MAAALQIPIIKKEDLRRFAEKHFPGAPIPSEFVDSAVPQVQPATTLAHHDPSYEEENLGYYPDGTSRTLLDCDIAMFRHTEIQMIIKRRRLRRENEESDEDSETERTALQDQTQCSSGQCSGKGTPRSTEDLGSPNTTNSNGEGRAGQNTKRKELCGRKRRNKKNKKRKLMNNKVEPPPVDDDEESDEWDPWHQATGPDAQKDVTVVLDY